MTSLRPIETRSAHCLYHGRELELFPHFEWSPHDNMTLSLIVEDTRLILAVMFYKYSPIMQICFKCVLKTFGGMCFSLSITRVFIQTSN